jgi:hypothetical protein
MMLGETYERLDVALEHSKMMLEASTKTPESHGFKTDYWCVFAGVEESEGIHNQRYVIKKEETTLSHEDDQYLDHFLSSDVDMEEHVVAVNKEELAYEVSQGKLQAHKLKGMLKTSTEGDED